MEETGLEDSRNQIFKKTTYSIQEYEKISNEVEDLREVSTAAREISEKDFDKIL